MCGSSYPLSSIKNVRKKLCMLLFKGNKSDILAYSDGVTSIFDLPKIAGCSLRKVVDELKLLSSEGLITFD